MGKGKLNPYSKRKIKQTDTTTQYALVFGENLIFSPLFAYSPTPKVTRNTLKPPNLIHNLYAT